MFVHIRMAGRNPEITRMSLIEMLAQQQVALPLTVHVQPAGHFALNGTVIMQQK